MNDRNQRGISLLLALLLAASLTPSAGAVQEEQTPPAPPTQGEAQTPPGQQTPQDETTKTPVPTAQDRLQLAQTSVTRYAGQYQNIDLVAPSAKVVRGSEDVTAAYAISYAWKMEGQSGTIAGPTLRTTPVYTGQEKVTCITTATAQDGSGRVLTGECVFVVEILPATAVGAVLRLGDGPQAIGTLKDLAEEKTLVEQLTKGGDDLDSAPAIDGLNYLIFDLSTVQGRNTGTLGAKDDTPYYLNGEEGTAQLSQLVFTPAAAGTYTVNFRAYGSETYFGRLELVVTADSGPSIPGVDGKTLSCDSAGCSFSGSDFYDAGAEDPVVALRFGQPASGRLQRGFAKEDIVGDELYYTDDAADGAYHISTLTYMPYASFNGLDTLPVTCITRSGQSSQRSITINVESKDHSDQFKDITASDVGNWAANAVDFAYKHKLVSGVEADRFSPNSSMTRGMLVTVLYRAAGSPQAAVTCNFTDLEEGAYYYDAVVWANAHGVVNGISAERFGPNQPVSRQQIAAILHRYASAMEADVTVPEGASLSYYTDAKKVDGYAETGMLWATANGIISGTASGTLSPLSNATRAQVVVMLHRYLAR